MVMHAFWCWTFTFCLRKGTRTHHSLRTLRRELSCYKKYEHVLYSLSLPLHGQKKMRKVMKKAPAADEEAQKRERASQEWDDKDARKKEIQAIAHTGACRGKDEAELAKAEAELAKAEAGRAKAETERIKAQAERARMLSRVSTRCVKGYSGPPWSG